MGEEVYPGTAVETDDEIDEYIRNTLHTANALTGTCKMGLGEDCVVGPDLKVFGVNNVRVCDSSIFPSIPGGQTATPTVMVADRAAAFILNPQVTVETYTEPIDESADQQATTPAQALTES